MYYYNFTNGFLTGELWGGGKALGSTFPTRKNPPHPKHTIC